MFLCMICEKLESQSGCTGEKAYRGVGRFVIHVNECTLNVWKNFNRVLELLADIMRFPQRGVCVHNNVDLNKVVWAALGSKDHEKTSARFQMRERFTWYARTVSIFSISSLNVAAL
jgi:hypothetical protein